MPPFSAPPSGPPLTRRALGRRLAGVAAALGLAPVPQAIAASVPAIPAPDPALREAALRGLALAGSRGDPVEAAAAQAAIDRLAQTDPEAALLARIYRQMDVRPAQYWWEERAANRPADADALALLHGAIAACQPVSFAYTDLEDNESERTVLPLVLVHPPQGVKLLAWCLDRQGYRQFFVRAMEQPAIEAGDFSALRFALLQGWIDREAAQV